MLNWKFWSGRQSSLTPNHPQSQPQLPPSLQKESTTDQKSSLQAGMTAKPTTRQPDQRINFSDLEAYATAWVSGGGILIKSNLNAVDLQYLGVSRVDPTPCSDPFDPVQEDAWAARLQQIGPHWYRSRKDWLEAECGGRPLTERETEKVFMAWPSQGGVWILRCPRGKTPDGFGRYSVCVNMDERAKILEKYGADYYADANECFELTNAYIDESRKQRDELG